MIYKSALHVISAINMPTLLQKLNKSFPADDQTQPNTLSLTEEISIMCAPQKQENLQFPPSGRR